MHVVRVQDDVSFLVEDLFRATFGDAPPTTPEHYLALAPTGGGRFETAGYYHVDRREEYGLVGGLCVAPRFRRMGIAERLERAQLADVGGVKAFFAYVGDTARAMRVGFLETPHEHLLVYWTEHARPEDKPRLIEEVAALGPF